MTPDASLARYPIRAVSKLTGIAIDTLRAWERRYGVVTPVRDERGRIYTEADVVRLRLLRGAVDRGHSIGRLAPLDNDALRDLVAPIGDGAATVAEVPRPISIDATALDVALRSFDAASVDREIVRFAAVLQPLDLLREVLMPLLVKVGDDWHRGRVTVAHEHLMSAAIRSTLGSFLRVHARPEPSARLVFATLSGDRHEMGTLGAALLAAASGLGVAYLGPDLPARDIVRSVTPAGAQVLVLGLTPGAAEKAAERQLRMIVRDLPRDVELWIGGRGAARHAAIVSPRGIVVDDYASYQQELVRIGGRAA
ncbi:MAG: MerR family transcriptional regulator [Acidobacteria bacterium]|nr:MerR family transcriptional regulator [Acidobacteriota bacterium]